jgi:hypothetical protein
VAVIFALGVAALVDAVYTVASSPMPTQWVLLAALVLVGSSFAVKVPALNATLSISETFLFALILMFGSAPAVLTVAIDGIVISIVRRHRKARHIAFNVAEPALSVWVAAKAYYLMAGVPPLQTAPATLTEVGCRRSR